MTQPTQPPSLRPHHIIDLYCWFDELVPKEGRKVGRPRSLTDAEIATVLVWNALVLRQKTLKDLYRSLRLYHTLDFTVPTYSAFVARCHEALPTLFGLLMLLLEDDAPIRILDSSMLAVCKLHRAHAYKTAKGLASFGKNHQGFTFGFKLHAGIDLEGRLSGLALTGAHVYDAQALLTLLNEHCRIAVGDTLYGAKVMGRKVRDAYGTVIIAPPWPKQKTKIAAPWQIDLLNLRSRIESVFDYLKEHLHLVSSFPRSLGGYLLHYVRILLGYQTMALLRG